jgi:hypothetical protein
MLCFIVREMAYAVGNRPACATRPEKNPSVEHLDEVLKTETPGQSNIPLVQWPLVTKDNWSTVDSDRFRTPPGSAKQIEATGAFHQRRRRNKQA